MKIEGLADFVVLAKDPKIERDNKKIVTLLLNKTSPHGCPESTNITVKGEPSDLTVIIYSWSLGKLATSFRCDHRTNFCRLSGCRFFRRNDQNIIELLDSLS
jgi:hypothetical protein